MRNSTARNLLRSLPKKRLKGFFALLSIEPNAALLTDIARSLETEAMPDEAEIYRVFGINKGQYYHWVNVICDLLTAYLTSKTNGVQLEQIFQLARDRVFAAEYEAALDLIRTGIRAAAQIENFALVVRFWELVEPILPPPKIEEMDRLTAIALRDNLNAYDALLARLDKLLKDPNAAERRAGAKEVLSHGLLNSADNALSKRATYFFNKAKMTCHTLLRNYEQAVVYQHSVVALVRDYPQLFQDAEYSLAKETAVLGASYRLTKRIDDLRELTIAFDRMIFKSLRAIHERDFFHYPVSIIAPLDIGDTKAALEAIHAFLAGYKEKSSRYLPTYVTENLYFCLYGALAMEDNKLWSEALRALQPFLPSDFKPKYYAMYRFIEIIRALKYEHDEDALRLIKNLKTTNAPRELQGMREVLDFLRKAIVTWQGKPNRKFNLEIAAREELAAMLQATDLNDYFDLLAWFDAQVKGCSMIDVIAHRANQT